MRLDLSPATKFPRITITAPGDAPSRLYGLHFPLFGPEELDGTGGFSIQVVVAGKIAINRDIAADLATGNEERFHDECALVVDVA
jgi:hypothetical protein